MQDVEKKIDKLIEALPPKNKSYLYKLRLLFSELNKNSIWMKK